MDEGIQRGTFLNGKWISYPRNIPASWDCAASPEEKGALWEFFVGTKGLTTGWRFVANDKWDNKTCPCIHKWRGVVCDSVGHIVAPQFGWIWLTRYNSRVARKIGMVEICAASGK